ncbi:MAG: DUF4157 domain-containing protein [Lentisphaeraceae bacterium]|nr:DUF4157 domain-containing protein [Lentisphaeraceae bacterium]
MAVSAHTYNNARASLIAAGSNSANKILPIGSGASTSNASGASLVANARSEFGALEEPARSRGLEAAARVEREIHANNKAMPGALKSGMAANSGSPMDAVNVNNNNSMPAQLNAHAYAQGSNIHLGAGQAAHLPHEAAHTVQQSQGRVSPAQA